MEGQPTLTGLGPQPTQPWNLRIIVKSAKATNL